MADALNKQQLINTINALTLDGEFSPEDVNYLMNYIIANGEIEGTPRDLIQIRRGEFANLPVLAQGELGYTFDTKQLFVGGLNGNVDILTPVTEKLNTNEINVKFPPVPFVAAVGNGVINDTAAITALNVYASQNKKGLYFPSGTYAYNETFKRTDDINSTESYEPISWRGENPNTVIFSPLGGFTGWAIDFRNSRNVSLRNITANGYIALLTFGVDENKVNSKRQVMAQSVFCNLPTGEPINWNMLITTPRPASYSDNNNGTYSRYPLEIHNYGGYNGIMIVNRNVDENGEAVAVGSPDNSAIGITDEVKGVSAPTFLIEMKGNRSFEQFKNGGAESVSGERQNVVYEVNQLGHVAIGCSTVTSDPNAPGNHGFKLRMKYPSMVLYDQNRSNHTAKWSMGDDFMNLKVDNPSNGNSYGMQVNYMTGAVSHVGTMSSANLTVTNNAVTRTVDVASQQRITFTNAVGAYVDQFTNSQNGQIIYCIVTNANTEIRHMAFAGAIHTKGGVNFTMVVGQVYSFIKFEDGWYEI